MQAILIASFSMLLAPAPVYKPLTPEQQKSLLKSAEEDIQRTAEARQKIWESRGRPVEMAREDQKTINRMYRAAAEKLSRVHADLPPEGRARAAEIAIKAGKAWSWAGDKVRSLHYFSDAAERGPNAVTRLRGLTGMLHAYQWMGKSDEVGQILRRANAEIATLGEKDRKKWESLFLIMKGK